MIIFTVLFVAGILGALLGAKNPWMGGIAGPLITPFLFFSNMPFNVLTLMITALALFLLSTAYGLISFIIISGLKGGGHNVGKSYMIGFWSHHPGSIIPSIAQSPRYRR